MALPESSLSKVCSTIVSYIKTELNATEDWLQVMTGNLADAQPRPQDNKHRLNLFFYRFEPSGFFPHVTPEENWWLRLNCLFTPFSFLDDGVSGGENELRLLGSVIQLFHEKPVLTTEIDEVNFHLQFVFHSLSTDDLNHIWSSQGEATFRSSVAYEISLIPIIPSEQKDIGVRVAVFGSEIRGHVTDKMAKFEPEHDELWWPDVSKKVVDISLEDWAPYICFIYKEKGTQILYFKENSTELAEYQPKIYIAGDPASEVKLVWEKWTKSSGWVSQNGAEPTVDPISTILDPLVIDSAAGIDIQFPDLTIPQNEVSVQAMLYAEHTYVRKSDETEQKVKSNLLMVTIYKPKS